MIDRIIQEAIKYDLDDKVKEIQKIKLEGEYILFKIKKVEKSVNIKSIRKKLFNVSIAYSSNEVLFFNSLFENDGKYYNDKKLKMEYIELYPNYFNINIAELYQMLSNLIEMKSYDEEELPSYEQWLKTDRRKSIINDISDI